MRYREIVEVVDVATERAKVTAAQADASQAGQTYQAALKRSRDRANAARRKLAAPTAPRSPAGPSVHG